jgi:hypothetical protein
LFKQFAQEFTLDPNVVYFMAAQKGVVVEGFRPWDREPGSTMTNGQSCGTEARYVTAGPPQNEFAAPWYRGAYPELRLETDEDALNDWNTAGQTAGRLPNANILTSMTSLGTVGYVDPNSVLHGITDLKFNGVRSFTKWSNVTGKNMVDCTTMMSVKYGDRVVLASNDATAFLTTDSVTKFGSKKVVFIVRPLTGSSDTGTPVKYGDKISLALSVTNYSSSCGYWGCKVGNVDPKSMQYKFGPGGATGGTNLEVAVPINSAYNVGDNVPYDAPLRSLAPFRSRATRCSKETRCTPAGSASKVRTTSTT